MGLRAPKILAEKPSAVRADSDDGTILEEQDVLNTLEREYLDAADTDVVRGIANGIIAGTALWAAAIAVFLLLT
jgi:hypothetical protein